ncbi:PREDICTED: AT-rich interactive domain-containing protein 1A-like [Nelumbo nucifera]|uniref:AT-rich interactive domain-containing protein 1A-like n=2 Tax=Nelumbo nucifera TaxID=4432 RepID=A0A1U7ZWS7_NELNU|nr:PREDICTED: AT-rich interactive domain-containing protein 1A-like [Nelumbo nucifera]DAD26603.1 TPA_asm: hypothetical protein HUJ06_028071 [Nelumbo nucifera]
MGFDNECILNIQSLAGEYFCPVCRLLVYPNEAIQSQCTHLYCKPCLTYVVSTTHACPYDGYLVTEADSKPLIESNKALAETIGKIAVHCLYHRSGCTWQGTFSDCTSHCAGCPYGNSPVVCNRCGAQIVHRQVQEHAQNCPGVQPQAQQAEGVQDATTAPSTSSGADQVQAVAQAGAPASQGQPSQPTVSLPSGQEQNQASTNVQTQAVNQVAPTPEQWYQQQSQYQQYYQQYPGYDPYQQQYQHYDPYQQAYQQYQQHPQHVQGQHQPQVYMQPQPQPLSQSQPQLQPQPQPQVQPPAPLAHPQAPVAVQTQMQSQINLQQQLQPTAHSQPQIHPQTQPPTQGQQPQLYPQTQVQTQTYPTQPHMQQNPQVQHQQTFPQIQQPQLQPQPYAQPQSLSHPQHHSHPQVPPAHPQPQQQPQPQQLPQVQTQPQTKPHTQHQLPTQPQPPQPSVHAVTGHQSYVQPQPHQQMPPVGPQQHPAYMHTQQQPGIPHQPPQHPVQMQNQFPPQQPHQMRPPQAHMPVYQHQQQPAMPLPQGQHSNAAAPAQLSMHPHAPQSGQPVLQHPGVPPPQQQQQSVPQPQLQGHLQHSQPFPGQTHGLVHNQPHQQGVFMQQQSMQPHLRPQGPPSTQQHVHAPLQPHLSQSNAARPMMPSQGGVQQPPFLQSPGGAAVVGQIKPTHLSANQPLLNQNYPPTTNARLQLSSEQQLGYMQQPPLAQSGNQNASIPALPAPLPGSNAQTPNRATTKPTVFDRQGDTLTEKSTTELEAEVVSRNIGGKEANGSEAMLSETADSTEAKIQKSENDLKSLVDEEKPNHNAEDKSSKLEATVKEISGSSETLEAKTKSHVPEDGSEEPVIKEMVKEDAGISMKPSQGGNDPMAEDSEDKKIQDVSVHEQKRETSEAQDVKLQKDVAGAGGAPHSSSIASNTSIQGSGQASGNDRRILQAPQMNRDPLLRPSLQNYGPHHEQMLSHTGYPERNLPQAQYPRQGPHADEYRNLLPPSQMQGKGLLQPHVGPAPDQQLPMHYGPPHQQRPHVPDHILQSSVPPHQMQPPNQMRPQGPIGHLPQQGQPPNPPEHLQSSLAKQPHVTFHQEILPSGFSGPGSSSSFGRGPVNLGSARNFESQPFAIQGHHNLGNVPPPLSGGPRIPQGEPVRGPPFVGPPPGAFDPQGGVFVAGAPHEKVPFGQTSGIQNNTVKINGVPGKGLPEERYKHMPEEGFNPLTEECFKPFAMEPSRCLIDRREFEEDLKQFPRPTRLDAEPVSKFENYFSSSRTLDRGPHGFNMDSTTKPLDRAPGFGLDAGSKLDGSASGSSLRLLPPYQPGGPSMHPLDVGERSRPIGFHDDIMGRKPDPAGSNSDFLRPVSEFGRHRADGLSPRSPGRDYPGIPTGRFGGASHLDNIEERESHTFGERSNSFNLPQDPVGSAFHERRFLPSHLRRGEPDGPGNLRTGEQILPGALPPHLRGGDLVGSDILPSHLRSREPVGHGALSHLRSGEHVGPRGLPSHLHMGETAGFGALPAHLRMGELAGPGNLPSRLRIGEAIGGGNLSTHSRRGEPGFGNNYSMQGYPSDGGFYPGDKELFNHSRKRKPGSMGWCRICKVDCETVEGLDLHSQTREHQKMAMDMVLSIKQDNAKKHKPASDDNASVDDTSKSRKASFESRGSKH